MYVFLYVCVYVFVCARLRPVDVACAQLLWDRGLIASDRHAHTRTRPGTSIFINVEDLSRASVLYNAILYKNGEAAAMAVRWGARVSDNAYVLLYGDRKSRREVTRLIPVSERV